MSRSTAPTALALTLILAGAGAAQQAPPTGRQLRPEDFARLKNVSDPQLSPDGAWVAYTVGSVDLEKDRNDSDIWMASWDGASDIRVTSSPESESSPRWSPDGRLLAFRSSRQEGKGSQIWLLDRRGGEAQRLTEIRGGISDYAWSPDAKRLLLVIEDPEPGDSAERAKPKPIVVDRYHFKSDADGYLDHRRDHLYLFDIATKKLDTLTTGDFDDGDAEWSPDGRRIAFISSRKGADPDRATNSDVYVIDARPGAEPRQLTTWDGPDGGPLAWSPDGRWISYLQGRETRFYAYDQDVLAIVPTDGGTPRLLTRGFDRDVSGARFSSDGRWLEFLVTDDLERYLARVPIDGGKVEPLGVGEHTVNSFTMSPDGRMAVTMTTASMPAEVYAFEAGAFRPLSHRNDAFIKEVRLASVKSVAYTTKDGNEVHAILYLPPDAVAGVRLPTLLRIHGGPNGQNGWDFDFERELFASHGYAVLSPNYRGSSGRGVAWKDAIYADWGDKEVIDLLAGMDHVVKSGVADPDRLGIGGWSYGCILTLYTLPVDGRFKAAECGAGSAMQIAMYGVDQYIVQYENELGPPWKNPDIWIRLSAPFFHADRIHTPTLFLGGEKDFNVPLVGVEQMYQALKSLNVPAQLIVYPGEHHGIRRPSFVKDRYERYLAWYDRYLKPTVNATGSR